VTVLDADAPRAIATERVAALAERFPDLGPGDALRPAPPLARAIEQEVRRRWLTLEAVLASVLDRSEPRRLEPRLRSVLLVGAAQLLLLEGEPDHAVVDEAVSWASARIRRGAGSLANAVLRGVASLRAERLPAADPSVRAFHDRRDLIPLADGSAWRLASPILPEEAIDRLAAQTSHGRELLLHWTSAHGFAATVRLAAHGLMVPPLVVAGELGEDPRLAPHDRGGFRIWTGPIDELAGFLARHPAARVQDPGSAAPVEATRMLRPRRILDLCAGRGTKTRQLAAIHPDAEIVAVEPNERRRRDLEALAAGELAGRLRVLPQSRLAELAGSIDLALLDVPCSNTAVLPRRPEARYRFSRRSLEELARLQRDIAVAASPLLAPSGAVLYATCSLEPAENERQAAWIADRLDRPRRAAEVRLPKGVPGEEPRHYEDGGFHALLGG